MSYTQTQIHSITADGTDTVRATINLTGGVEDKFNFNVPANGANYLVNANIVFANLVSWFAYANQSIKIKTNSNSAPQDTINVTANSPSQWWNTSCYTNVFAGNVTAFYIDNNTANVAAVSIYMLRNA